MAIASTLPIVACPTCETPCHVERHKLHEHYVPVGSERLRLAAQAVLDCGVGNLSGDKYRARVEAFDALDDALEEQP